MQQPQSSVQSEVRRLAVLKSFAVAPHPALDTLTKSLRRFSKVDHVLITIVDVSKVLILSQSSSLHKFDREFVRAGSFCSYDMDHNELFVVPDVSLDPKLHAMAMAREEFKTTRFYATAPLLSKEGSRVSSKAMRCDVRIVCESFSK